MAMRVSGINSGLDTDAIVQELVSAYSKKTEKYEKEQTKLSWKQDIWKSLNSKVYGLYTKLSNMRYSAAYSIKKVNSSDTTKATVSAGGTAVSGTHKLNVLKTAQSAYLTGRRISSASGEEINVEETKLQDLEFGVTQDAYLRIKTKDGNGQETYKDIKFTKDNTINDVVTQLQDAGLNASFDTKHGRFYISSKSSGSNSDFEIVAADTIKVPVEDEEHPGEFKKDENGNVIFKDDNASDAQKAASNYLLDVLGLRNDTLTAGGDIKTTQGNKANLNTMMVNLGVVTSGDISDYGTKIKVSSQQGKETKETVIELGATTSVKDVLSKLREAGISAAFDTNTGKFLFHDDSSIKFEAVGDSDGDTTSDAYQTSQKAIQALGLASVNEQNVYAGSAVTGVSSSSKLSDLGFTSEISFKVNGEIYSFDPNKEISDVIKKFTDDGIGVKFVQSDDGSTGRFEFDGKADVKFEAAGNTAEDKKASRAALDKLGLYADVRKRESQIQISGEDAEIKLDGVTYTNSTNDFSINGLNISAQGVTGAGENNAITINTSVDSQGLYDTVKNFLTEYNAIINEITKLYNADSARGYDPLTDEEKDAMSDTEISKWETKIKDSLLRRDSSLSSIMSAMINSMNTAITVGGKSYNLTSFGIHTLGFLNAVDNEQNAFHINGDSEDENTSGEEDKLMKAIQNDPDTVVDFMKQLSTNLYNAIDKQMQGTSLRSRYKIYNDKELDTQYKNYTSTIKEWEKKVSEKEDYYYKKFSQMETALAKLNSQQSSLAGLLGN